MGDATTAYLALGSNLGDRLGFLERARTELARLEHSRLLACSRVYETTPVGGPGNQGPYLNAVLALATSLPPLELLRNCQFIEAACGREREKRWGARTLDIDLLLYGREVSTSKELTLPHPRMHRRAFVMRPLCDLAPTLRHPVLDKSMEQLLDELAPAIGDRCLGDW